MKLVNDQIDTKLTTKVAGSLWYVVDKPSVWYIIRGHMIHMQIIPIRDLVFEDIEK